MPIERKAFIRYNENKKDDGLVIPLRLNVEQVKIIREAGQVLEQTKDSTIIKQLMIIGHHVVIHDQKIKAILDIIFKNKRNNTRLGIVDFD